MIKPETPVGAVLPFPASRERQGNQTDHQIYQILESADRLMTALSLLRNSYTAMMVGMPLRNAAEILTQADAALRQAENVMGQQTGGDYRDPRCAASTARAAFFIPRHLALDDTTKEGITGVRSFSYFSSGRFKGFIRSDWTLHTHG
jgi:hypothetical protein